MAEIPTFQEMEAIDTDGDGEGSDAELAAWAAAKAPALAEGLTLTVDGRHRAARGPRARGRSCCRVRAGCQTLRFEGDFVAPPRPTRARWPTPTTNFADLIGWREITRGGPGRLGARRAPPCRPTASAMRCGPIPRICCRARSTCTTMTASFAPGVSVPGSSAEPWRPTAAPRPGPVSNRVRSTSLLAQPGVRADPAGGGARGGLRRLARAAARPRQDADGRLHGGFEGAHTPGGLGRHGRGGDAHGVRPGPRTAGPDAGADVPPRDAVPVARVGLRAWWRWDSAPTC